MEVIEAVGEISPRRHGLTGHALARSFPSIPVLSFFPAFHQPNSKCHPPATANPSAIELTNEPCRPFPATRRVVSAGLSPSHSSSNSNWTAWMVQSQRQQYSNQP